MESERIARVNLYISARPVRPGGNERRKAAIRLVSESGEEHWLGNPLHSEKIFGDYQRQKDIAIGEARRLKAPLLIVDRAAVAETVSRLRAERAAQAS
jgi:hypothetical protein